MSSRVISTSPPISALKQTDSACRPAMKRIVWQQTWRGLHGWTYLTLDFPVGVGAAGIEVSDQVARKVCASIFDAKQRAESLHPRTKLTPTCVGTCHHNGQSVEPPMRNLGPTTGNHIPRVCNVVQVCLHRRTLLSLSFIKGCNPQYPILSHLVHSAQR